MRILIGVVTLCLSCACAAAGDEEQCLYGPDFSDALKPLKNKYPHSRYTKDRSGVVIPLADGEATVSYTGCVHFGMEVSLLAARSAPFTREEAFSRAVGLVRQFNMLGDPKKLEQQLAQGKYQEIRAGAFIVDYPDIDELAIESGLENGHAMLRISYSCC